MNIPHWVSAYKLSKEKYFFKQHLIIRFFTICPLLGNTKEKLVVKYHVLLRLLLLFLITLNIIGAQVDNRIINDIKSTERGALFLQNHNVCSFMKVLRFLDNPVEYWCEIETEDDIFVYIEAYENYLKETNKLDDFVIYKFLQNKLNVIDETKAKILGFLLLRSDGVYAELIAEHYSRMFENHPDVFIADLGERKDWKEIVCRAVVGDEWAFLTGLQKAKECAFKKDLIELVRQCIKKLPFSIRVISQIEHL